MRVGPPDPAPSEARVAAVFEAYCAELRRLFDEHNHKDQCLPPDPELRGSRCDCKAFRVASKIPQRD